MLVVLYQIARIYKDIPTIAANNICTIAISNITPTYIVRDSILGTFFPCYTVCRYIASSRPHVSPTIMKLPLTYLIFIDISRLANCIWTYWRRPIHPINRGRNVSAIPHRYVFSISVRNRVPHIRPHYCHNIVFNFDCY